MTLVRVVEEVSRADGATGWCVALIGEYGVFGGYLSSETAHEIYGNDPNVRTAGQLRAAGEARVVDGGYRVTGRWPLGSGCQHANWIVGGCQIFRDGKPCLKADGTPISLVMFFPAADCLPGAIVEALYVEGNRIDSARYEVLKEQALIRWTPADQPQRVAATTG